jgi:hypothetical protein
VSDTRYGEGDATNNHHRSRNQRGEGVHVRLQVICIAASPPTCSFANCDFRGNSYNSFAPSSDPEHASQQTVWEDIGVKVRERVRLGLVHFGRLTLKCEKVLEHAWNGFNVSLFAYGQTGTSLLQSHLATANALTLSPHCRSRKILLDGRLRKR